MSLHAYVCNSVDGASVCDNSCVFCIVAFSVCASVGVSVARVCVAMYVCVFVVSVFLFVPCSVSV